jgi:hypothetical protein
MKTATEEKRGSEYFGVLSPERIEWSERVFELLKEVMNEIHDMDQPVRFWKLIIEDHVRSVISRKEHLDKEEVELTPDLYPMNTHRVPGLKMILRNTLSRFRYYLATRKNPEQINRTLKDNDLLLINFEGMPGIQDDTGGVHLDNYEPYVFGTGDSRKREIVNKIASRQKDVYEKNIIKRLPKIYVEHFRKVYDRIELHQPEKKVFHIYGRFKISYRQMVVAKYLTGGAKIIWYQDGAFISEVASKYSRYLMRTVADEFRTWGWTITDMDRPWKPYPLEKFRKRYRKFSDHEKIHDLLLCFPKLRARKEYFRERSENLLMNLDRFRYSSLLARPQPSNNRHSHASELEFITDNRVEVSTALTSIQEDMSKCRAVVQMNVPATNMLECVYVGMPVFGILNNENPTELIKPYYDFLLKQGVLHETAESLATHLNRIEITDWWAELEKHPTFKAFRYTFARDAACFDIATEKKTD